MTTSRGIALGGVLFALCAFVGAQTAPPEQYPGQHDHAVPPKDWHCYGPDAKLPEHRCSCKNMPKDDSDPICNTPVEDDAQCSAFCHKEFCRCKTNCPD